MKKILLDLSTVTDRDMLYDRITEAFTGFPDYFGRNLDALYDCLTEICEDTCVGLFLPQEPAPADDRIAACIPDSAAFPCSMDRRGFDPAFGEYLHRLRRTFEDAEEENEHLCVIISPYSV